LKRLKLKVNLAIAFVAFIVLLVLSIFNTAYDKEKNMESIKLDQSEIIDLFKENENKFYAMNMNTFIVINY
jgi:flagellar biosynthesis protein FlhB